MSTDIIRIESEHPFKKYWTSDDSACEICGRRFDDNIPGPDMYDPEDEVFEMYGSIICHLSCGQARGLEEA